MVQRMFHFTLNLIIVGHVSIMKNATDSLYKDVLPLENIEGIKFWNMQTFVL